MKKIYVERKTELLFYMYYFIESIIIILMAIFKNDICLLLLLFVNVVIGIHLFAKRDDYFVMPLKYESSGRYVCFKSGKEFIKLAFMIDIKYKPVILAIKNKKS